MSTFERSVMERNLTSLRRLKIFFSFMFLQFILVLYYDFKGIELGDFFIAQTIFAVTAFLFEIPFGIMSDQLQKRTVIIFGTASFFIGVVLIYISQTLVGLYISSFFLGLGFSAYTSSYSALLYDSLLALGREDEHDKIYGSIGANAGVILAISAATSSFLYKLNPHLPILIQAVSMVVCIAYAFLLVEPKRKTSQKSAIATFLLAVKTLPYLKWIFFLGAIIAAGMTKAMWFIQAVMLEPGYLVEWTGGIIAIFVLVSVYAGKATYKIRNSMGIKKLLLMILLLSALGFFISSYSNGFLIFLPLLLVFFASGISSVIIKTLIHEGTESKMRTTVMAIYGSIVSLFFGLTTYIFGAAIDAVNTSFALSLMSIVILFIALPSWYWVKIKN